MSKPVNTTQLGNEVATLGHSNEIGTVNGVPVCYHDENNVFTGEIHPACAVLEQAYAAHTAVIPEPDSKIAEAYQAAPEGKEGDEARQLARDKMMGLAKREEVSMADFVQAVDAP